MSRSVPSDIEIARRAELRPIEDVAGDLGLDHETLVPYGRYKAKVPLELAARPPRGSLVLVTGMNPTAAGEGKSTVSVGLVQALKRIGINAALCLREPSLGPVFGIKGGAAGGGYSQVVPMEDINLHFTGDLHAITSAHALLSAMLDNHLHRGNRLGLDVRRITWQRAVDMNDRSLRNVIVGLGGPASGVPRQDGFVITAASEVMAVFCLARSLSDMTERLGRIVVGYTPEGAAVTVSELKVEGALSVLLKDALAPNLVQTLEGGPAFVHGGPFGNIAHGCNSLVATRAALALADLVVTEAGFGSELGGEKFFNIKSRVGGLEPKAAVIIATARALRRHGGASLQQLADANPDAVGKGLANLERHITIVQQHGVPPIVAVNRFDDDSDEEFRIIEQRCRELGVPCLSTRIWAEGGQGGIELAEAVRDAVESCSADLKFAYPLEAPIAEKVETIVRDVYGGSGVVWTKEAEAQLGDLEALGYGELPICMAKTQYSLSDDATKLGRPESFEVTVRELRVSAGAGFIVAYCGNVMTMPGLAAKPAAEGMRLKDDGEIEGLF
ncbi:MAG: formate--tetrahydrofolate ligase [Gemmatimonadota bacterium]